MPISTINQYFQSLHEIHGIAGRKFRSGSQNLASGLGHLWVCGKSRGLPGLLLVRIKGHAQCGSTLQVSATVRIYGRKSLDLARLLSQITLALVYMPTLKGQHPDTEPLARAESPLTAHSAPQAAIANRVDFTEISWGDEGEDACTHSTNAFSRQKHLFFLQSYLWPPGTLVVSPSSSNRDCPASMTPAFLHSLSFPLGLSGAPPSLSL